MHLHHRLTRVIIIKHHFMHLHHRLSRVNHFMHFHLLDYIFIFPFNFIFEFF